MKSIESKNTITLFAKHIEIEINYTQDKCERDVCYLFEQIWMNFEM